MTVLKCEQKLSPGLSGMVFCVGAKAIRYIVNKAYDSLAVKCKSEENCAFDDKSTIFGTEIIEILKNIF